jgi:hypothetical protein
METPVDHVTLPLPRGAEPARLLVHFEDAGAEAVHPAIAPGGQPGDAAADDDDGFIGHGTLPIKYDPFVKYFFVPG